MPFTPRGMFSLTPFTTGEDEAAPVGAGSMRVGKFTHPSAAPGNDLLVVWSPGPANDLNRPTPLPYYDAGLYLDRRRECLVGRMDSALRSGLGSRIEPRTPYRSPSAARPGQGFLADPSALK